MDISKITRFACYQSYVHWCCFHPCFRLAVVPQGGNTGLVGKLDEKKILKVHNYYCEPWDWEGNLRVRSIILFCYKRKLCFCCKLSSGIGLTQSVVLPLKGWTFNIKF